MVSKIWNHVSYFFLAHQIVRIVGSQIEINFFVSFSKDIYKCEKMLFII